MNRSTDSLSVLGAPERGSAGVLLTPGRTRNIAQDMEAVRLSRQDNPYLQQVLASRESLIESHADECDSDDVILMSQELSNASLDGVEEDPLALKEVHEHMIRSPPPASCWPHESVSRAGSAFDFGGGPLSFSAYSVDTHDKLQDRPRRRVSKTDREESKPPACHARARPSRSISPRAHDGPRPLSLPGESQLRVANKKQPERLSLLQQPPLAQQPPLVQQSRAVRRRGQDSVRLFAEWDK